MNVAGDNLLGVSTRRMERLVESLGITRLSKSQVSAMAADLDEQVAAFRSRPLDAGPYTFLAADALVLKVREASRVVNVHALIAVGVNADGHRELLGLQVSSAEDGAGWLAFFRDLGVEVAGHLTDLRLAQPGDPQRLDQLLHPPGADPEQVAGGHHGGQRPFGPAAAFQQPVGEVRPSP